MESYKNYLLFSLFLLRFLSHTSEYLHSRVIKKFTHVVFVKFLSVLFLVFTFRYLDLLGIHPTLHCQRGNWFFSHKFHPIVLILMIKKFFPKMNLAEWFLQRKVIREWLKNFCYLYGRLEKTLSKFTNIPMERGSRNTYLRHSRRSRNSQWRRQEHQICTLILNSTQKSRPKEKGMAIVICIWTSRKLLHFSV